MVGRPISCDDFLNATDVGPDEAIEGAELVRLFWTVKQRESDLVRREKYWASIKDALTAAYGELDTMQQELRCANELLEKRVADQVGEIREHAREVEALNVQLQARVRERSRELLIALRRTGLDHETSFL